MANEDIVRTFFICYQNHDEVGMHHFKGDINTSAEQHLSDVSEAERKSLRQPDAVRDDLGWEALSLVRAPHPKRLKYFGKCIRILGVL